jgi:tRNA-dihydrouridine synthase
MTFWDELPRPFVVMAPMADVTDPAFRSLVAACGAPDVFWTEFVSADGLYHTREIARIPDEENPLMRDLIFKKNKRPIVAQLFSSQPSMMRYAAALVARLGFDGVDINMGCPDTSIERQGCGSAMIKNPQLAQEIIKAAQEGSGLPVSVKTRVGYLSESLATWLPVLFDAKPAAITLHLRTRKELSLVPARWELMRTAVELRAAHGSSALLIGNGDVRDREDALVKIAESGCDGAMIGRGMFGNPWVFSGRKEADIPFAEKCSALIALAYEFETLRPQKNFSILKKHIKAFVTGFDGASALRTLLMTASSASDLERMLGENPL